MRRTRTTGVGMEAKKKLRSTNLVHKIADTGTVSPSYSDGTAVIDLKTGKYTYQAIQLSVRCTNAIVGETVERGGLHYLTLDAMSKYVSRIRLEIDGVVQRDLPTDMMVKFQQMRGMNVSEGMLFMIFGGPHQFDDKLVEDAYMLGTHNIRSLRILFDLTSEWVNGQMHLQSLSEYAPAVRAVGFIRTIKSYRYQASAAGEYTISDLPVHADIAAYYVLGSGIKSGGITVDDQTLIEGRAHELQAFNLLYGEDVSALGDGVVFDFLRTKEITKGLKSLERADQRKRNADIRITLDMDAPGEILVIADQVGPLSSQ